MQKRVLGRTGIEVSEMSFGTVSLGVPYGIGVDGKDDMISGAGAIELLRTALDKGVNFFDTARGYGCKKAIFARCEKSFDFLSAKPLNKLLA